VEKANPPSFDTVEDLVQNVTYNDARYFAEKDFVFRPN